MFNFTLNSDMGKMVGDWPGLSYRDYGFGAA
jgi:hypothetical protein